MGEVIQRLQSARERLDAKDLPGAMALYEEVLAEAGERADVLVTISGDLGSTGHVAQIIELIAPRYDAARHGPAAGLNLLQAYLAVRDANAAQHVLDLLFSLNRPDLEERLFGFSNAISELLLGFGDTGTDPSPPEAEGIQEPPSAAKIALVTISRPIWTYGLEALVPRILPQRSGRLRRLAFTQLSLPEAGSDLQSANDRPENEMTTLARAIPAWLADGFHFSASYGPLCVLPYMEEAGGARRPIVFPAEWTVDHLRQLSDTDKEGIDYAVTGALRHRAGDYELVLRVWEMKKFRERKQFTARWTPATADAELAKLRDALNLFMEWTPAPAPSELTDSVREIRPWLDVLGASLILFLAEKGLMPRELLPPLERPLAEAARLAPDSAVASLAWLTLARRCGELSVALPSEPELARHPLVVSAREAGPR